MKAKNTICLWYDKDPHDAARFYAATFPNSEVTAVHRAPAEYPSGRAGDVLTVEFTLLGLPCLGLNGGPAFKHSEAFSFQVATDTQEETDRYWSAIVGNGGQESACGWCNNRLAVLADHARRADRWPGRGRRRSEARVRGDDDDDKGRHREDRSGPPWLRASGDQR